MLLSTGSSGSVDRGAAAEPDRAACGADVALLFGGNVADGEGANGQALRCTVGPFGAGSSGCSGFDFGRFRVR